MTTADTGDHMIASWKDAARQAGMTYFDNDPGAHQQLEVLRGLLNLADDAMTREGLPVEMRRRILDHILYGGAPTQEAALERIAQHRQMAEELERKAFAGVFIEGQRVVLRDRQHWTPSWEDVQAKEPPSAAGGGGA